MKKELPIGAEDFINVKKNYYYVNKTPLLMELAKAGDGRVYLFTRPRRFRKSLMLSTIRAFFEKAEEDKTTYFEDTAIWKSEECRREAFRHPVIYLNFKECHESNAQQMMAHIQQIISNEYRRFDALLCRKPLAAWDEKFLADATSEKLSPLDLSSSLLNRERNPKSKKGLLSET